MNPLIETIGKSLDRLKRLSDNALDRKRADTSRAALARIEALLTEAEARAVRAEAALEQIAQFIEGRHKEGDTEYQVVIIARAALAGQEGKPVSPSPEEPSG